jgi:hypothetical protein
LNFPDLAQQIQMALKALLMYTEAHPRSQGALETLHAGVDAWLADRDSVQIEHSEGKIFLDGVPAEGQNLHMAALLRQMKEREIAGFVIRRGVGSTELLEMLKILILKPAKLEERGGVSKVMADLNMLHISLSQTEYKAVRAGDTIDHGSDRHGTEVGAAGPKDEFPAPSDFDRMVAGWMEGLTAIPTAFRDGAVVPADLGFCGPLAIGMGWGDGFPTAPKIEAFRQAAKGLSGPGVLSLLAGQDSLPNRPGGLGMAFRAIGPDLMARAVTSLVAQGMPVGDLQDALFAMVTSVVGLGGMANQIGESLRAAGVDPRFLAELMGRLDWEAQALDGKLDLIREGKTEVLWDLNTEQRVRFIQDLLADRREGDAALVMERLLEQLRADDPGRREAAASTIAKAIPWVKEPGMEPALEGQVIQGLVAHFGWEPLRAIHAHTARSFRVILECLVERGDLDAARTLLEDLEGLCAILDPNEAWRVAEVGKLRAHLVSKPWLDLACARIYELDLTEASATILPYLAFLGTSAASQLMASLGDEPDRKRRARIMDLLRAMGPAILPSAREGLRSETWHLVRNALNLLAELGDASLLTEVQPCLNFEDARVRRSAVRAMWKLGGPTAAPALLGQLHDPDVETQVEILFGLGQIRVPSAIGPIAAMAQNRAFSDRVRLEAVKTLGQIGRAETLPALVEVLSRKGHIFTSAQPTELRLAAAKAMVSLGTPAAMDALRKVVEREPRNQDRGLLQAFIR